MGRRTRSALIALSVVVLLPIGAACVINATAPFPHRLAFTPGDGSITPIFVVVTQGERHTNYTSTTAGKKVAQICYVHTFYYASQNSIQPTSPLRYWTGHYLARALHRFFRGEKVFWTKKRRLRRQSFRSVAWVPRDQQHLVRASSFGIRTRVAF